MRMAMVAVAFLCGACGGEGLETPGTPLGAWIEDTAPPLSANWAMRFAADGRYEREYLPARYAGAPADSAAKALERGGWMTEWDRLTLSPDGMLPWPELRWQLEGDRLGITWPPHLLIPFVRVK